MCALAGKAVADTTCYVLSMALNFYSLTHHYTVSKKTGPLLRFEITPTNCA